MRVILDTNVLVAAVATRGACAELFACVLSGHIFAVDDYLLLELEHVLRDKLRVPEREIASFVALLRARGEVLEPAPLAFPVCRDASDDPILALALAFAADVIVTGDPDLLVLDPYEGVRIIKPAGFWPIEREGR